MTYTTYYTQSHPTRFERGKITGEIGGQSTDPNDLNASLQENEAAELGEHNFETEWHNGTTFVARGSIISEFPQTEYNKDDEAVLSGLPIPCMLEINGTKVEVDDGSLELDLVNYGMYYIRSLEAGYKERQWVIYAL